MQLRPRKLLQTLEISEYKTRIKMSNKRNKKYYYIGENKNTGKPMWRPRDLPKTYKAKLDEGEYTLKEERGKQYLLDEEGEKIVANPRAAGTPRYWKLSGNDFMSGYGSKHVRHKLTTGLKDFYRPIVKAQMVPFKEEDYPLTITWEFHSTLGKANWDIDNMFFYWKYLQDVLEDEGIIVEDNIKYITASPGPVFVPVDSWEDRKFVFRFYKDERKIIEEAWKDLD